MKVFIIVITLIAIIGCADNVNYQHKNGIDLKELVKINSLKVDYRNVELNGCSVKSPIIDNYVFNYLMKDIIESDLKKINCDKRTKLEIEYRIQFLSNNIMTFTKDFFVECKNSPSDSYGSGGASYVINNDTIYEILFIRNDKLTNLVKNKIEKELEIDCQNEYYTGGKIILTKQSTIVYNPLDSKVCLITIKIPFSELFLDYDFQPKYLVDNKLKRIRKIHPPTNH